MPLLSPLAIPFGRFLYVKGDAYAVVVHQPKNVLCFGMSLFRRFVGPFEGFLEVLGVVKQFTKIVLRGRITRLRQLPQFGDLLGLAECVEREQNENDE